MAVQQQPLLNCIHCSKVNICPSNNYCLYRPGLRAPGCRGSCRNVRVWAGSWLWWGAELRKPEPGQRWPCGSATPQRSAGPFSRGILLSFSSVFACYVSGFPNCALHCVSELELLAMAVAMTAKVCLVPMISRKYRMSLRITSGQKRHWRPWYYAVSLWQALYGHYLDIMWTLDIRQEADEFLPFPA